MALLDYGTRPLAGLSSYELRAELTYAQVSGDQERARAVAQAIDNLIIRSQDRERAKKRQALESIVAKPDWRKRLVTACNCHDWGAVAAFLWALNSPHAEALASRCRSMGDPKFSGYGDQHDALAAECIALIEEVRL